MGKNSLYGIDHKDPRIIKPDPENVRYEDEEQIEGDESFQRLKESVYTFGVLVPLAVKPYKQAGEAYKYILIDGERRLRAALATNQEVVPVHILKKTDLADQMLYAFQIHMLRKEWSRTAQARALLKIIKKIKKETGKRTEKGPVQPPRKAPRYRFNPWIIVVPENRCKYSFI